MTHLSTVAHVRNTIYMLSETSQNVVYLLNEHILSTLALLKVGEMFLSYHSTMHFMYICKSNCSFTDYFIERLLPYSSALQL